MSKSTLALLAVASMNCIFAADPATVLVIGIDGFRPDFAERPQAAGLKSFRDSSVRARYLAPEFPSVTFPNFYSMVTGLVPARHGIVGMSFYDPARKASFHYRDQKDGTWFGGEPIWNRAERNGIRTATYFWVGSEWPVDGGQPSIWYRYDGRISYAARVTEVERWLSMPPAQRPRLMMVYFSAIDSAVHSTGTESPRTAQALADIDAACTELVEKARKLVPGIHIVMVSDHGSANNTGILDLSAAADYSGCEVRNDPPLTRIWCESPERVDEVQRQLQQTQLPVTTYTLNQTPEHWKIRGNRRSGDLLVVPAGLQMTSIVPPGTKVEPAPSIPGMHGYDESVHLEMRGILWAQGPLLRSPGEVGAMRTPDLYLVLANILGIGPSSGLDASADRVAPLFLKPPKPLPNAGNGIGKRLP